jgi:hypothetical protein
MYLRLITVFLSLFISESSASTDTVNVYCAKECSSDDPCGDGKGQSNSCLTVTFDDATTFGFDETDAPDKFLGCSHSECSTACSTMDFTKKMNIVNGTFCFPKMEQNGFMTEDMAELAAVSRGCSGNHDMDSMYMIGDSHMACMSSYSSSGVTLGSDDGDGGMNGMPSSSAMMQTSIAVSLGPLFAIAFMYT